MESDELNELEQNYIILAENFNDLASKYREKCIELRNLKDDISKARGEIGKLAEEETAWYIDKDCNDMSDKARGLMISLDVLGKHHL